MEPKLIAQAMLFKLTRAKFKIVQNGINGQNGELVQNHVGQVSH